jgi:cyclopropane fatty-acyl-phospholipid synthase-like methyltransferase
MWRRLSYAFMYRTRRTPWDTGVTPPEVVDLVEGAEALPPGRALDLGCGTGTNVTYLARHGWTAVGVDSSRQAIDRATSAVAGVGGARVIRGDVTKLDALSVGGPFDLVLDIGCFHSIARPRRDDYASGVATRTEPGATLFVFAFRGRGGMVGVTAREMRDRFAPAFEPVGRITGTHPPGAAWYRLRRR